MRVHLFWFGAQRPRQAPAPMLPCQKMDTTFKEKMDAKIALFVLYYYA